MPHLVIFLHEPALLPHLAFGKYGQSNILAKVLTAVITEIARTINRKKFEMKNKKAGSVVHGEPKLIWIKFWTNPCHERYKPLKSKFNAILEEILTDFKHTYILDVTPSRSLGYNYDRNGNLTNASRAEFWHTINAILKKFDRQEVSLKPVKVVSEVNEKEKSTHNRFALPRPPPKKFDFLHN